VFGEEVCLNITSKLDDIFNMEKDNIACDELNEFAQKKAPLVQ